MSKITQSANGEECTIRIPFACKFSRETVVWAHANGSAAGKGMWMKSPDILGAYACHACHGIYDRQIQIPKDSHMTRADVELAFWEGHARSVVKLLEKGLLVLERGKVMTA